MVEIQDNISSYLTDIERDTDVMRCGGFLDGRTVQTIKFVVDSSYIERISFETLVQQTTALCQDIMGKPLDYVEVGEPIHEHKFLLVGERKLGELTQSWIEGTFSFRSNSGYKTQHENRVMNNGRFTGRIGFLDPADGRTHNPADTLYQKLKTK